MNTQRSFAISYKYNNPYPPVQGQLSSFVSLSTPSRIFTVRRGGAVAAIIIIMSSSKEDQQQVYEQLDELRQRVHLSSNKLLELTYNDSKYVEKLVSFNADAKRLINDDMIPQALVYLAEAERVLQYGASCGKTIDRNMIICTLHNEACCYYKEADLVTASRYIEGVIFNLKSHLASIETTPANSHLLESHRGKKHDEFLYASLEKKIELVQYYLKFCTINSQAKNREVALDAGRKVLQISQSLFQGLSADNPKITACDENNKETEIADLRALLKKVRVFRQQIELGEMQNYIRIARYYVKRWNECKVVKKINFSLEKHVNNYSISEVIDMMPMEYVADDDEYYNSFINTRSVMRQLLHFSMGYFTVSTEYRLIAEQLYKNGEERAKSEEYIRANIYHLLSILFLALNLNCDLLFMKQIVSSYEHHFKIDLTQTDPAVDIMEDITEKLLFEGVKAKETKGKLSNNSLIDKINKLKSKEKEREREKKVKSQYEDSYVYQNKVGVKMNQSKTLGKKKRSVSKNGVHVISSSKKLAKVNQTILESSKNLNTSKDKSISISKQPKVVKKRSVSKQSSGLVRPVQSAKPQEKTHKRTNDEYQLNNAKSAGRKRTGSVSSVDISCRSLSKTKQRSAEKTQQKKGTKKKMQQSKKKKKSTKEEVLNKHYYL